MSEENRQDVLELIGSLTLQIHQLTKQLQAATNLCRKLQDENFALKAEREKTDVPS